MNILYDYQGDGSCSLIITFNQRLKAGISYRKRTALRLRSWWNVTQVFVWFFSPETVVPDSWLFLNFHLHSGLWSISLLMSFDTVTIKIIFTSNFMFTKQMSLVMSFLWILRFSKSWEFCKNCEIKCVRRPWSDSPAIKRKSPINSDIWQHSVKSVFFYSIYI